MARKTITLLLTGMLFVVLLSGSAIGAYAYDLTVITDPTQVAEKYQKENRQFAAIPSVEVTGDRIWAAWMSGGDEEPHEDNYITVAFSDDGGQTWTEPHIIVDPDSAAARSYNPVLWHDPDGRLWLFWGESGLWCSYTQTPEADPSQIRWSAAQRLNGSIVFNKPIAIVNGEGQEEWLMCTQNYQSTMETLVYSSLDRGETWELKGSVISYLNAKMHHEPMMVQKNDGTLWMLSRVENGEAGGIEQTFSSDDGESWSTYEYDLAYPLRGPGSRFNIYKLASGNIVLVNHDSTQSREKIAIWMSEDDGETFPYKLMLDSRDNISYPDIAQDEDGTIYVVYDVGRSVEQEIRMARFTEEDIRFGDFVSDVAAQKMVVTKTGGYEDILYTVENYEDTLQVTQGASLDEIIGQLPSTVTVITDSGASYTLTGEWEAYGNTADPGEFRLVFQTELPEKVQDVYEILTIRVVVSERSGGCSGSVGGIWTIVASVVLTAAIVLVWRRRRETS